MLTKQICTNILKSKRVQYHRLVCNVLTKQKPHVLVEHHCGGDERRIHAVDAHAAEARIGEVVERAREADHAVLGGAIDDREGHRQQAAHRRDIDNRAAATDAAREHVVHGETRALGHAEEADTEHLGDVLALCVRERKINSASEN
jgi:hypothetical protein